MRQRALIAMALACDPALLVCDEPTAALDVTISAQILSLLADLRSERQLAMLLVSHDLALVRGAADRVAVMYAGQLAEVGPAAEVLSRPRHPYTAGLLHAREPAGPRRLSVIPGQVPALGAMPTGCRFRDRCGRAQPDCAAVPVREVRGPRSVACFHPLEDAA
jgi:oligopeptide/dipeptide ABC transporter ATP-binding protein